MMKNFGTSRLLFGLLLLVLSACASQPVTKEQTQLEKRRLVQPYLEERQVFCNELDVTCSANLLTYVSNPGVDQQRHRFERTMEEARVEKVWTNLSGAQNSLFTVTITEPPDPTDVSGKKGPRTRFFVLNQFRLHVRERGNWRLDAVAKGPILMVKKKKGAPRDVRSFEIVDGVVTVR